MANYFLIIGLLLQLLSVDVLAGNIDRRISGHLNKLKSEMSFQEESKRLKLVWKKQKENRKNLRSLAIEILNLSKSDIKVTKKDQLKSITEKIKALEKVKSLYQIPYLPLIKSLREGVEMTSPKLARKLQNIIIKAEFEKIKLPDTPSLDSQPPQVVKESHLTNDVINAIKSATIFENSCHANSNRHREAIRAKKEQLSKLVEKSRAIILSKAETQKIIAALSKHHRELKKSEDAVNKAVAEGEKLNALFYPKAREIISKYYDFKISPRFIKNKKKEEIIEMIEHAKLDSIDSLIWVNISRFYEHKRSANKTEFSMKVHHPEFKYNGKNIHYTLKRKIMNKNEQLELENSFQKLYDQELQGEKIGLLIQNQVQKVYTLSRIRNKAASPSHYIGYHLKKEQSYRDKIKREKLLISENQKLIDAVKRDISNINKQNEGCNQQVASLREDVLTLNVSDISRSKIKDIVGRMKDVKFPAFDKSKGVDR